MFSKVPLPCRMSRTQIGSWKHLGVFDERLEGAVVQALLGRLRGAHILVSFLLYIRQYSEPRIEGVTGSCFLAR